MSKDSEEKEQIDTASTGPPVEPAEEVQPTKKSEVVEALVELITAQREFEQGAPTTVTTALEVETTAPQGVVCPGCRLENAIGEEFCLKCGSPLTEEARAERIPEETAPTVPAQTDPLAAEEMRLLTTPPYSVLLTSHGLTHPGLSGKNNEDAVVVDGVFFPKHNIAIRFLVVVDGMGGEKAGEIAANIAVHDISAGLWFLMPSYEQHLGFETKLDFWRFANGQYSRFLVNQLAAANTRVFNYGKAKKLKQGNFGATVVVAVAICDLAIGRVTINGFVAGDPRCYLVLDDKVTQLSEDQTIAGFPSSFLGAHPHLTGKAFKQEVWMGEDGLQSLTLLSCTDGFWNMLGPDSYPELAKGGDAKSVGEVALEKSLTVTEPFGRQFDPRVTTGDDNITLGVLKLTANLKGAN